MWGECASQQEVGLWGEIPWVVHQGLLQQRELDSRLEEMLGVGTEAQLVGAPDSPAGARLGLHLGGRVREEIQLQEPKDRGRCDSRKNCQSSRENEGTRKTGKS